MSIERTVSLSGMAGVLGLLRAERTPR